MEGLVIDKPDWAKAAPMWLISNQYPMDLSDVYILLFFCLWPDNSGRRRDNRTFENRWSDQISAAATFTGKQTELSVNERKQRMEDESTLFSWKKTEFLLSHSKDSFLSIKAVSFRLELEERHILLVRLSTKGSFLMANS